MYSRFVINYVLLPLAMTAPVAPRSRQLVDNEKARILSVDILPTAEYGVKATRKGCIWIVVDGGPGLIITTNGITRAVSVGDKGEVSGDDYASFHNAAEKTSRLVLVEIKSAMQKLTVEPESLMPGNVLEDASARNDTLLVAISALKLRHIWNRKEDEGKPWKESKPEIMIMRPGDVRWVRSGVHTFENLLRTTVRFVTIEW